MKCKSHVAGFEGQNELKITEDHSFVFYKLMQFSLYVLNLGYKTETKIGYNYCR